MKKWSRHLLAAGALALGMSAAHADDNNTLYFYNWTEYVPPGLLEQFTKETGIKVIYSTYESNETMYAKLKTYKDGAYDLVVPSTYYVDKMRKEGMILWFYPTLIMKPVSGKMAKRCWRMRHLQ